jgi:hypothetical protein
MECKSKSQFWFARIDFGLYGALSVLSDALCRVYAGIDAFKN